MAKIFMFLRNLLIRHLPLQESTTITGYPQLGSKDKSEVRLKCIAREQHPIQCWKSLNKTLYNDRDFWIMYFRELALFANERGS